MRKWILLLSIALIYNNTKAQGQLEQAISLTKSAKQDAIINKLVIYPDSSNVDQIITIFSQFVDLSDATTYEDAIDKIKAQLDGTSSEENKGNDYLRMSTFVQDDESAKLDQSKVGKTFSGFGSLDVTNLAIGLTDFLIERAKTELNTAFFKRFKNELEKDKTLKLIFPKTFQILNLIDVEIYQYDLYLNNMKLAFQEDLDNIYENLPTLIEKIDSDKLDVKGKKSIQLSLKAIKLNKYGSKGGDLINQTLISDEYAMLLNEYKPKKIKQEDNSFKIDSTFNKEYRALNTILFLNMLAESFRKPETVNSYLGLGEIEELKNETTRLLYLGLLYEVSKQKPYDDVVLKGDQSIQKYISKLKTASNDLNKFLAYANKIIDQAKDIEDSHQALKQLKKELSKDEKLSQKQKNLKVFEASNQLYFEAIQLMKLAIDEEQTLGLNENPEAVKKVITMMENIGALGTAAVNKQYIKIVTQTALILRDLFEGKDEMHEITAKVLRYGTFMATLIEAESPEQAKNAIAAAALPPGSYSIKRESAFSVALNGYIGGFIGNEDIGNDGGTGGFNNLAVTAPVGVSVSWGNICKQWKNPWSVGLNIPLVDLGVVASYRLDDSENDVEDVPSIQLGQLFAPGAFFELGIGATPLTLSYGVQMGSRLRSIEAGANANVLGDTYFRHGLSLKVDIPLMQFYAKPAKRYINGIKASKKE